MNYFLDVIQNKYAQFSGRATRSEYWYFTLFFIIAYVVAAIIDGLIVGLTGFPILTLVVALGLLVPSIAVGIRRLHDINKSGWWMLLSLIPLISLVLIAFFVIDSKEDNVYGPNPKV
ncbi:MAG: DUF805 domain-containing protein [uncultured Sulfurovum sp.]|uniref:DUF805 domain-containing protein n=1 Tax=uncultured Sulfurovum sp. TaxID=269237 RepID=A0A6S6T027_9BACT|nr:MAG: DUF805 domain-containing protein [uncultured Sulfurovum sp.]